MNMAPQPTISVIIPCYNATATLSRALRSVLAQDCAEPLEIIVVDDGSEDNPQALLTRDFSGVHYMRQKHTGVPGVARNRGALAAQGEFLAFLDADDAWQPEKLRRQLEFLRREPEVALVLTRCMTISQEGDRIPPPAIFLPEGYRLRLAEWLNHQFSARTGIFAIPSTWLIRRSIFVALGGQDEALPTLSDWHFISRLLAAGYQAAVLLDPLTENYKNASSLSRQLEKSKTTLESVPRKILAFLASLAPSQSHNLLSQEAHAQIMFAQARAYAHWMLSLGFIQTAQEFLHLALSQPILSPRQRLLGRAESMALSFIRLLFGPSSNIWSHFYQHLRRVKRLFF